ncbi:MAG: hypothetical protein K2Z80_01065 [Xanthobacteraceae bacterium]|nr:hypothetical protein [Xanthobacteraceae bacterium]
MNAPTSASADHAAAHASANAPSHPANPALAHPARLEDGGRSFVARLASSSIDKLDGLIAELKEMREVLRFEGERVQREVGQYAQLAQSACAVTKAITETVPPAGGTDAAGQNAVAKPPSGGREKLKRWPPPAG